MTAASRRRSVRLLAGLAAGAALVAACSLTACDALFGHTEHFVIRVDSIVAPAAIAPTDTLYARFFGTIGPDGCWSLEAADFQVTTSLLNVTFRGVHRDRSGYSCTQMQVQLDMTMAVPPPVQTPFTITVHQPDGSKLQRVVATPGQPAAPARDPAAMVQTDSLLYHLMAGVPAGLLRSTIAVGFRNTLPDTVYVVNCNGTLVARLEQQTPAGWQAFPWSIPIQDCLSPPLVIAPGATFTGSIALYGGRLGGTFQPQFGAMNLDGVYRLVWQRLVLHYGVPRVGGEDTVPEALRRSNAFALDDPDY